MIRQGERNVVVQDGFSIVEALIAAALIGLAFVAISTLFPTGYSNITYGGRETTAVAHAQQKIEQLKAIADDTSNTTPTPPGKGFNAINTTNCSTTPEILADPLVPTITFARTCILTTNAGTGLLAADLKKVRVTVTWDAQTRPGSVVQETLFTR